ncbi:MAG: glycosyltransferase family 4 protein [Acidimicrobiia bacterium]
MITSNDRRGAEVFGCQLNSALTARGRAGEAVALAPGSDTVGLPVPVLGRSRRSAGTLAALRRRSKAAGAVIAHGSTTLPMTALALAGTGVPLVYRNVGDPSYWATTRARRFRTASALRRTRAVVALTSKNADALARIYGLPEHKLCVIPNGVPAERFHATDRAVQDSVRHCLRLPRDAAVILYLGTLSPEKDVATAIRAVAQLKSEPRETILVVAGDGRDHAPLERLAAELAAGRVHFVGPVDDPETWLAAADALVLPSLTEGLPGVLIEAAFAGLPVVATDVGSVREIVVAGETGLLVPPRQPGEMAASLRHALARASEMGQAAREHCLATFDMAVVAPQWDDLLAGVCG